MAHRLQAAAGAAAGANRVQKRVWEGAKGHEGRHVGGRSRAWVGPDGPEPKGRTDCTHAHIEQHVHVSLHVVNGSYVPCARLVLRYKYRVQEWRK